MLEDKVRDAFIHQFGTPPEFVVRAPGRVNIIGEHTDYNDGFVFPMAIDRAVWIALRSSTSSTVSVHSLDFAKSIHFDLRQLEHKDETWGEYIKGVAWSLIQTGYKLQGWEGVVSGDVPLGAGLSSSAALELATARAFSAVSNFIWDPSMMARICQTAENKWVGVNCGIMDQLISAVGIKDHAVLIDCRSFKFQSFPLPPNTTIVVLDTSTRRGLVDSAYNERRQQCEAAADFFGVSALRDVSFQTFEQKANDLDEIVRKRARHIITENTRTINASEAMKTGNPQVLGKLMNQSHESLKNDFEVSSNALDEIVNSARKQPGCYGARMTGAGFGGCAIALVASQAVEEFTQGVCFGYAQATGLTPIVYICQASNGASLEEGIN
ncbi:MAG: galactokinase [Anaerolineaceae bacterium]|nr:galactokinase [Anaerolineaceae bacterium]